MKADLAVDIETVIQPATASDVEAFMADYEPPGNYKTDEAIHRHYEKTKATAIEKIEDERRFSFGKKTMVSAAIGLVGDRTSIQSWQSEDSKVIAEGLVAYLNDYHEYRLIGWNHEEFDLPEISKAFYLAGVRPKYRPGKWDVIDLCRRPFYKKKMKEVAAGYGLEVLDVGAKDVGRLVAEGNWPELKRYNEHDVYLTGEIFRAASTIFSF